MNVALLRVLATGSWAGAVVAPFGYWFGLWPSVPEAFLGYVPQPSSPDYDLGRLAFGFMESLMLGVLSAFWLLVLAYFLRYAADVLQVGSLAEYRQQKAAEEAARNAPRDIGALLSVVVNRGGFLSNPESVIETQNGFYRVQGAVTEAEKGAPVVRVRDTIIISGGERERRFTLVD
ncbi:hypothetical protein [Pseudomonas sp. JG-B]|uniref:hypothetical protein n=1 Tax=Pseudomonas sp. JG-B TaxID=2603214 RepID=UPI00129DAF1D|nr:hypothetical protein [Pseudomonas sp. JG-B]MRK19125.1 hypothetical protein [Pseudomonas sp. JG-B]